MGTRYKNEKEYPWWRELGNGGRLYEKRVPGVEGGSARYFKEVDSSEKTIRYWQETFDREGNLDAVHEKFPIELGHQYIKKG